MRVYDLAKELGKDSSKEILDLLQKHNISLKSSSNITEEQASIVKGEMGGRSAKVSSGPSGVPAAEGAEPPKKKIAAVFRPQNAQMKQPGPRPQSQGTARPLQSAQAGAQQPLRSQQAGTEPLKEQNQASHTARPAGELQGNKEGRSQGGSAGQSSHSGQAGHSENREGGHSSQSGYQGNRDGRTPGQGG